MATDTSAKEKSLLEILSGTETISGEVIIGVKIPLGLCIVLDGPDGAPIVAAGECNQLFYDAVRMLFEEKKSQHAAVFAKIDRYWQCGRGLNAMYGWSNKRQRFERTSAYDLEKGLRLNDERRVIAREILGDNVPELTIWENLNCSEGILRKAVRPDTP